MQALSLKPMLLAVNVLAIFYVGQANAMTLLEAYEAALANDTVFQSAIHENEAGQQFKVLGKSNLLPNVSANYSYNRNNTDITTKGPITRREDRDYNSENAAIQLRQPIFNMESWAKYNQGLAQTNLSDKQFLSRKQELIERFFGLFANAKFSEEALVLAEVQRDALKKQEEANALMATRGEGTKTALIESRAKLRLSEAEVIESKDALNNANNALSLMINKEFESTNRLGDEFSELKLDAADYETWKTQALEGNPDIATKREALQVASQEVKRNRAGHMPRLDAVASISQSDSDSIPTFQQELDTKSIGLQLNIPIYAGGSVSAATAQAEANYKRAQDDLDTKTNEVLLDLRKNHNGMLTGALKIDALKQSVEAADQLMTATKKSLLGGVRTNLDVLNARSQLFEAKRDLAEARYQYLVAYVRLKKAAGLLNVTDLQKIASFFVNDPRAFFQEDNNYLSGLE